MKEPVLSPLDQGSQIMLIISLERAGAFDQMRRAGGDSNTFVHTLQFERFFNCMGKIVRHPGQELLLSKPIKSKSAELIEEIGDVCRTEFDTGLKNRIDEHLSQAIDQRIATRFQRIELHPIKGKIGITLAADRK